MSKTKVRLHPYSNTGQVNSPIAMMEQIVNTHFNLTESLIIGTKERFLLPQAVGSELDDIGNIFGLSRNSTEEDADYRTRIGATLIIRKSNSIPNIKDSFEILTGIRPTLTEDFDSAKFYSIGESPPVVNDLARFVLTFPIGITRLQEFVPVNADGTTITVTSIFVEPSTPNPEAYDEIADPFFDENLAITMTGSVISIKLDFNGGVPYTEGKEFFVRYDIKPKDAFDTFGEVSGFTATFDALLQRIKSGGVTANFSFVNEMISWFQDTRELLVISDSFSAIGIDLFLSDAIPEIEFIDFLEFGGAGGIGDPILTLYTETIPTFTEGSQLQHNAALMDGGPGTSSGADQGRFDGNASIDFQESN